MSKPCFLSVASSAAFDFYKFNGTLQQDPLIEGDTPENPARPFHGPHLVGPRSCQQPNFPTKLGAGSMESTKCFDEIRGKEHQRNGCDISIT